MRVIVWLLGMAVFMACVAKEKSPTEKINMQQERMIALVNSNDITGVKKSLEEGADVNTSDNERRSLLLLATINKQSEMAKLLVENGADVNQQSSNQDSPFLYAGASGQTSLVKLFLDHGARFDVFNRYHGTALIPACEKGHVETVRLLVNTKNYPINHINRLGWTALMETIVLGDGSKPYQEIIKILKNGGADLSIPDKNGVTAIQHAKKSGFDEIVKILAE